MSTATMPAAPVFNTFVRRVGSYNLLAPREEQAAYFFKLRPDAPSDLTRTYHVSLDEHLDGNPDHDSALEMAEAIHAVYARHWINTDRPKLEALIAYLRTMDAADAHDAARARVARAEKALDDASMELVRARRALAEYDDDAEVPA